MTLDERIHEIALDLIRRSSMKYDFWRVTRLDSLIPELSPLQQGELPLVSATFPQGDCYLWTTRRLITVCDGITDEMPSSDITEADFGMFKGSPAVMADSSAPLETLVAVIHSRTGRSIRFRYELGYAAMAPIQCHTYWTLKHPIIHKLLTPTEIAAYRASRRA